MSSNGKNSVLGRDIKKHISCGFVGHEEDCSISCEKCAIHIKTCGDEFLAEGKVDLAIKQYKRALFAEPKFAEAWVNLGNAFGMKAEYNNSLAAFEKAIAIDPVYGKAMFGKAISLRNLGEHEAAMSLADAILHLYDNANVRKFKESLLVSGAVEPKGSLCLDQAIEKLTDIAYEILLKNDLLGPDNTVVTEKAICQKEEFSAAVYRFSKRLYAASDRKKIDSESIIIAFYGSLCLTLLYYDDPNSFAGANTFNYLTNCIDLEKVEDVAEKMLKIRDDSAACEALWNLIYGYVTDSLEVFDKVTPDSDIENAVLDATESAYIMGMMYAMKWQVRHKKQAQIMDFEAAINRLVTSVSAGCACRGAALDHGRIPPRRGFAMVACSHCGKNTKHMVVEGHEQILEKYQLLSDEFTQLGFNSTVDFYCSECAMKLGEIDHIGMPNNIVISVMLSKTGDAAKSHPAYWAYKDAEYQTALAFLKGADTISAISKATSTSFSPEEYIAQICAVLNLRPN